MKSPFPGMDPCLESPAVFSDFHDRLVTYLSDDLQAALPEPYYARLRERVYVEAPEHSFGPDVGIVRRGHARAPAPAAAPGDAPAAAVLVEERLLDVEEPYIEIIDARTGHRVVTVIEVLSPSNKRPGGEGAEAYRAKQREVLRSDASLVEIDLLRGGEHVAAVTPAHLDPYRPFHYMVVVCRATRKYRREVYPIRLRQPLPRVRIPLREPDADVEADLQSLVGRAHERGAYWKSVDYSRPAEPPLADEEAAWARGLPTSR